MKQLIINNLNLILVSLGLIGLFYYLKVNLVFIIVLIVFINLIVFKQLSIYKKRLKKSQAKVSEVNQFLNITLFELSTNKNVHDSIHSSISYLEGNLKNILEKNLLKVNNQDFTLQSLFNDLSTKINNNELTIFLNILLIYDYHGGDINQMCKYVVDNSNFIKLKTDEFIKKKQNKVFEYLILLGFSCMIIVYLRMTMADLYLSAMNNLYMQVVFVVTFVAYSMTTLRNYKLLSLNELYEI